MKQIFLSAAVAAATLATQPALAQNPEPFTGGHADLEAGWGRVGGERHGSDGFIYGGRLGYDFALGSARIGPEVEVTASTQKACRTIRVNNANVDSCQRTDRDLYIGGRLGYVISPTVMAYGKVGYSNGRFGNREGAGAWHGWDRDGYRVGGGLEYEFISRFLFSLEYRYSHYKHDANQNQVMGGVGIRF